MCLSDATVDPIGKIVFVEKYPFVVYEPGGGPDAASTQRLNGPRLSVSGGPGMKMSARAASVALLPR